MRGRFGNRDMRGEFDNRGSFFIFVGDRCDS